MADALSSPKDKAEFVGGWCEAINAAKRTEKTWREVAKKAVDAFRGEQKSKTRQFNIYHSNIEILVPAIYNSTPIPDVRRRYSDADPVGKTVADILERALSYQAECEQFDDNMELSVYDMAIAGRGAARVRYEPVVEGEEGQERIASQAAPVEYVPWDRLIVGPAITWKDVTWIAFEHFLSRDEVKKLAPDLADQIPYSHTAYGEAENKKQAENTPEAFRRARIYEVWDKLRRSVIFICEEYSQDVLRMEDDPLGLKDFFPMPRPAMAIRPVGSLVPVSPYDIYKDLLEELNEVTRRISRLVKQLRPRGGYAGKSLDIKPMIEADDGEMVPLQGEADGLAAGTYNVNNLLTWFPMEPTVAALAQLLLQRDAIKQTIYEVTGIADIMRGSSDPRETRGAQELKAQFGSVRVRDMQKETARFARDLMRLQVEVMAKHFEPEMLLTMTGIRLLPAERKQMLMMAAQQDPQRAQMIAQQEPELVEAVQAPSIEDVFGVLQSDKLRSYRIDIETDSTIRNDLARNQEQMSFFLSGTAQYLSAIGPMVKEGAVSKKAAVELYAAFARQFNLGKSAEDALEGLAQEAEDQDKNPQNAEGQKGQAEAQAKVAGEQIKVQSNERIKAAELQQKNASEDQDRQAELAIKQLEAQLKARDQELEAARIENDRLIKLYELDQKDAREREKIREGEQTKRSNAALQSFTKMNQPKPEARS